MGWIAAGTRDYGASVMSRFHGVDTPADRDSRSGDARLARVEAPSAHTMPRFSPPRGCLFSIIASIVLTVVLNLLLRGCSA